ARSPCFPGGGDTTCCADVNAFNAFDTFCPTAKEKPATRDAIAGFATLVPLTIIRPRSKA
ncbi:MAG TPA: hypothetical protein VJQ54_23235, partial [Candidatus Sulfotelmatobacter sp.]|nr:hypothetical protein [Candidatus Sulfotelmatobacter sp.]